MIYLQLFVSYLKIGFFGFGGGYAMLSLIQNEVVVQHAWMSNAEFADIVAVSQMTPGPIAINSATYVGYTVGCQAGTGCWCGILGSVIATFAVCLPSLTVMLLLTRFFLKLKGNRYIEGAMAGMKPVVIGMIAGAAADLPQDGRGGRVSSTDGAGCFLRHLFRGIGAQTEPDPADPLLGRGGHCDLLRPDRRLTHLHGHQHSACQQQEEEGHQKQQPEHAEQRPDAPQSPIRSDGQRVRDQRGAIRQAA